MQQVVNDAPLCVYCVQACFCLIQILAAEVANCFEVINIISAQEWKMSGEKAADENCGKCGAQKGGNCFARYLAQIGWRWGWLGKERKRAPIFGFVASLTS